MKSFEDICKMTQSEVKTYMKSYLEDHNYDVADKDGFLYAKGAVPVLIVAHMDTVHEEQCKEIVNDNGKLSSPQGIGGDDRCGVFAIMNIINELNCSVLLCEDEENGGKGARKFTQAIYEVKDETGKVTTEKYIDNLDVNYMVEFDRRGNKDAVFYSCDNKDFIDFVEDMTCFKYTYGSFSDISVLMPAAKLSGVNLSSGYYKAHTTDEYVVYDEMMDTIEAAKAMIKEPCDKPFEYVAKKYEPPKYSYPSYSYPSYKPGSPHYHSDSYGNVYNGNLLEDTAMYKDVHLANIAKTDMDLELEVVVLDLDMSEQIITVAGETKAECWMNLFLENPNMCFNDIVDYSWG